MATDEARWPSLCKTLQPGYVPICTQAWKLCLLPKAVQTAIEPSYGTRSDSPPPRESALFFEGTQRMGQRQQMIDRDKKWGHTYLDVIKEEVAQDN